MSDDDFDDHSEVEIVQEPSVAVKKKIPFRFSAKDDVALLKEVISIFPQAAGRGKSEEQWLIVHSQFKKYHATLRIDVEAPSSKTIKAHVKLLTEYWRKEELASLRKSGCEEEYEEKEHLLTDLAEMLNEIDSLKENQKTTKNQLLQKAEKEGDILRKAALEQLSSRSNGTPTSSTKRNQQSILLEYFKNNDCQEKESNAKKMKLEE